MNRLRNRLALYQGFDLLLDRQVRLLHQSADDAVGAGVGPVGTGKGILIRPAGLYIINDAPGIVHLCAAKLIAVVPLLYCLQIHLQIIELQHCFHFIRRKTEILRFTTSGREAQGRLFRHIPLFLSDGGSPPRQDPQADLKGIYTSSPLLEITF